MASVSQNIQLCWFTWPLIWKVALLLSCVLVTRRGFGSDDWIIDTLYTQLWTTGKYSAIHNSLTVTSNHTWSLLCTVRFFSCHYSANSRDSSIVCCNCQLRNSNTILILAVWHPHYLASGWPPRKTPLPLLLCVDSLLQRYVYCTIA
jgi:hypothetical protein